MRIPGIFKDDGRCIFHSWIPIYSPTVYKIVTEEVVDLCIEGRFCRRCFEIRAGEPFEEKRFHGDIALGLYKNIFRPIWELNDNLYAIEKIDDLKNMKDYRCLVESFSELGGIVIDPVTLGFICTADGAVEKNGFRDLLIQTTYNAKEFFTLTRNARGHVISNAVRRLR